MKFVIVDYGMGNIKSISTSLQYLGINKVSVSSNYDVLQSADKLILPGVGSFGRAMRQIKERHLDLYLDKLVREDKKPILGICLGMQLMSMSSDEGGDFQGLGFVDAEVRKFQIDNLKIPHVGFNQVQISDNSRLFSGIHEGSDFYFTHSYRMISKNDISPSYCEYGERFVASFEKDNMAGVQFHPELSQYNGLNLLRNFIEKF